MTLPRFVLLAAVLALSPRPALGQSRAGAPFPVNAQTAGQQRHPAVARLADGNLAVVWPSLGGPGGPSVQMRRLDPLGAPLGPEVTVNLNPPALSPVALTRLSLGFSATPALAADGAGNAFVVWAGPEGDVDILARLYRADGSPAGGEIRVNADRAGVQDLPAVAAVAGGFVVAWNSPDYCEIRARLFDRDGRPTSDELTVAGPAGCLNYGAQVAGGAAGGFVVGWTGEGGGDDPDTGAFVRRFSAAGLPLGGAVAVPTVLAGSQGLAALASAPDGGFVAAWIEGDDFSPQLPYVRAQRFDPQGAKVGAILAVSEPSAGRDGPVAAGLAADGGAVFAWGHFELPSPPNDGVFARVFGPSGTALGPRLKVSTGAASPMDQPALALGADGAFVVIGVGSDGPGSSGLFGQRLATHCEAGPNALCLRDGRFRVEAAWSTGQGASGLWASARPSPPTPAPSGSSLRPTSRWCSRCSTAARSTAANGCSPAA